MLQVLVKWWIDFFERQKPQEMTGFDIRIDPLDLEEPHDKIIKSERVRELHRKSAAHRAKSLEFRWSMGPTKWKIWVLLDPGS